MNGRLLTVIALAWSACAFAQDPKAQEPMSKAQYQVARKNIESDFRGARIGCEPMTGTVKDRCLADVTEREGIAVAELEAVYQPGVKTHAVVRDAKAQAGLLAARARCKEKIGREKAACLKDADAASVAARAAPVGAAVRRSTP
jgi:hypothetical protein